MYNILKKSEMLNISILRDILWRILWRK